MRIGYWILIPIFFVLTIAPLVALASCGPDPQVHQQQQQESVITDTPQSAGIMVPAADINEVYLINAAMAGN